MDGERACDSTFVPRLSPIFVTILGGRIHVHYSPSQSKHGMSASLEIMHFVLNYI